MSTKSMRDEPWFDSAGYPFESHFLSLGPTKLHYVDEGKGPPVLLLHGTPGWSYEWRETIRALSKAGHRVIAPDLIGFGLSEKPAGWDYSLRNHTATLRVLLAHLSIRQFALVVHDFAGPVGMPLLLEAPERITHLAVLNSWMWPLSINPEFAKGRWLFSSAFLKWAYVAFNFSAKVMVSSSWGKRTPLTPARHRHFLAQFPDSASRHGTLGFLRATHEVDSELEAMWAQREKLKGRPTLLIWGMADTFIPHQHHLKRWKEAIPGARVLEIPDAGHFPHDEAPEEVTAALTQLLKESP